MAWYFYDSNGNLLQVTGAHTLDSHSGTLAITAGGTGATSATAAASALGVGTEDSPEFTGINVGHASDTTITKHSTGNIAVEGSLIYRAGGTDVPLTDGGTGASSASAAATALGLGTGSSPTFVDTTLTNDLLINSAGIINFASGNMTITHATGSLTIAGGTFATAALTASGVVTGTTVEATADTSANDNAAMGYTSAEGLILTGQGSTNDITIKNDADAAVISIPTGTTGVTFAGTTTLRSIAYTWPASDAAGSLRSDGSGALTWTAVSAGVGLGLVIALGG